MKTRRRKRYFTARSDTGLRMPSSGVVLGQVAALLGAKGALRDVLGNRYKTAQRYFKGERVEPKAEVELLELMVDAIVPALALPADSAEEGLTLNLVVHDQLVRFVGRWNEIAAAVNVNVVPISDPADLPLPALRLIGLEAGIRYGAWLFRSELTTGLRAVIPSDFPVLSFRSTVEELMERNGLTRATLAEKAGVSRQAVNGWLGRSLPREDHIGRLARLLPDRSCKELRLRLVVALDRFARQVRQRCGAERMDDIFGAIRLTAELTCQELRAGLDGAPIDDPEVLKAWRIEGPARFTNVSWAIAVAGPAYRGFRTVALELANRAKNDEVMADLKAVASGNWTERLRFWISHFGALSRLPKLPTGLNQEDTIEWMAGVLTERRALMSNFDRPDFDPSQFSHFVRIPLAAEDKAVRRVEAAQRAASLGKDYKALRLLEEAIQLDPQNPVLHFKLGCRLGIVGVDRSNTDQCERGIEACRIAIGLDPEFGNARNEIGVILSNMGRYLDAETAFGEAEPFDGERAHHWFARGCNSLHLGRLDEARLGLEKAIERTAGGQHTDAKRILAAVLMALGRTREGRNLGKKVAAWTGHDPTENWRLSLSKYASALPK